MGCNWSRSLCWKPSVHSDGDGDGEKKPLVPTTPPSSRTPPVLREAFQITDDRRTERRSATPPILQEALQITDDHRTERRSATPPILQEAFHERRSATPPPILQEAFHERRSATPPPILQEAFQITDDRRTERRSARPDSNLSSQKKLSTADRDADADPDGDGDGDSSLSFRLFPKYVKSRPVAEKEKLDKKLQSARKWRKVCFGVHKVLCAVGMITTVVLTFVCGPVATAVANVATTACLAIGPWLKLQWDAYERGLEERRDALVKMERSVSSSERMLRRAQSRFDVASESLLRATRDLKEKTATAAAAAEEEMKNEFMKSIDSLEEEVERCRGTLRRAMADLFIFHFMGHQEN